MNKNELVSSVADASGLSKVDAAKAVDGAVSYTHLTLPTICSV